MIFIYIEDRIVSNCKIDIEQFLGETISDICSNGFHKKEDNHCAHFVSHILGFRFGYRCIDMTGQGSKDDSANIKVHQVFSKCPGVDTWTNKPPGLTFCLAFITSSSNVNLKKRKMINHPKKHIGIFHNGMIYHYSNSKDKVVKQTPVAFSKHYTGSKITVYYGAIPK